MRKTANIHQYIILKLKFLSKYFEGLEILSKKYPELWQNEDAIVINGVLMENYHKSRLLLQLTNMTEFWQKLYWKVIIELFKEDITLDIFKELKEIKAEITKLQGK